MTRATGAAGARDMALQALLRVDKGEAVQAALDSVLKVAARNAVDVRESSLCTEMVYGYLRTSLRIGAVLRTVLPVPDKLPKALMAVLGLSVHSLLFLQRVPAHAVVHWAVEAAGKTFGKKMGGLVNGVLRSVQRLGEAPLHPDFYAGAERGELETRCLFYSMPLWVGELWHNAYGAEACAQLLRRSFAQPWPCLRLHAQHVQYAALRGALLRAGGSAAGLYGVAFGPGTVPHEILGQPLSRWHEAGALSWQAAGSLHVLDEGSGEGLAAHWQSPVWDACAGQGGKALALMERGAVVALCSDVHAGRLRQMRTTARRLRLPCPGMALMAADRPALAGWQGTIVLDAPCSGLGTLARRPEIRTRRTADQMNAVVDVQRRMLRKAGEMLGRGGHLVYMTCTLNPAENEEQVALLCREQANVHPVFAWQTPHGHPWLEGMFVSVLHKA